MDLLSSPLFANLSPAVLQTLERMALQRRVEEGSFFFMEGDDASHLYFLTLGRVHVFRLTPDGKQIGLRIVTPGMMFGAVAAIRPEKGYPRRLWKIVKLWSGKQKASIVCWCVIQNCSENYSISCMNTWKMHIPVWRSWPVSGWNSD